MTKNATPVTPPTSRLRSNRLYPILILLFRQKLRKRYLPGPLSTRATMKMSSRSNPEVLTRGLKGVLKTTSATLGT